LASFTNNEFQRLNILDLSFNNITILQNNTLPELSILYLMANNIVNLTEFLYNFTSNTLTNLIVDFNHIYDTNSIISLSKYTNLQSVSAAFN
jgi:hypothetical protein